MKTSFKNSFVYCIDKFDIIKMDKEDEKFLKKLKQPTFIFLQALNLISVILGIIYFFVDDNGLYLILFLICGFTSLFIEYKRRKNKS